MPNDPVSRADLVALGFAALIGLGLNLFVALPLAPRAIQGDNDFPVFYMGGALAGSPALWDAAEYMELQQRELGSSDDSLVWIRPPFYALLLKPLSWLPFRQANAAWLVLRLAALGLAAATWRFSPRAALLLAVAVSPALMANLLGGQDALFVLGLAAAALFAAERGRPVAAGMVLSLATIKFNLLLPLPLLLAAQRRWRILQGVALGGVGLAALSVAAAGASWPADYLAALRQDRIHPNLQAMPSLSGLLSDVPQRPVWQTALTLALLAAVWFAFQRCDLRRGWALALATGVLAAPHAYLADCALLLPALLYAVDRSELRALKLGAMLLLFPPLLWLLLGDNHLIAQLATAAFVTGFAWETWRAAPAPAAAGES